MRYVLKKTLSRIQRIARAQVAALLIITVIVGTGILPQKAEAIPVTVTGGIGTIQETLSAASNAITSAATSVSAAVDTYLAAKEITLDGIAFWLAQTALRMVAKETISWINSGFQGNPAFVGDLDQFLLDRADEIFGEFINSTDLAFLCSPFRLDIKISLALGYKPELKREIQCTLSEVIDNVDGFLAGDFLQGGLPGLFEVTQNPSNNFFGAQANTKIALVGALQDGQQRELQTLSWGDGFISNKECLIVGIGREECTIKMPGKTISEALNFKLTTGERKLLEADEINEYIGAAFAGLANQALQFGLTALNKTGSGNGGSAGLSYLDQLGDPSYDAAPPGSGVAYSPVGQAIVDERAYRGFHAEIISRAESILERVEVLETPVPGSGGDNGPDTCDVPSHITTRATALRDQAIANQASADANLALLADIQTRVEGSATMMSSSTVTTTQAALNEFLTLQSSGTLHSSITNAQYRQTHTDNKDELAALSSELEDACRRQDTNGRR